MVREYVGARYVPKFMGTFDATQSYEALCVVDNGLGTSYISKIPTPAGTPLTDTDHWAIYGASSGAIINLQQQIDDMKDGTVDGSLQQQIDIINKPSLKYKNIIAIGDSWGEGYMSESGYGWTHYLKDMIDYDSFYELNENSIGFVNIGTAGHNFQTLLQANESVITNPDDIDCIIVAGGYNDVTSTQSAIETAISQFVSYAENLYPNATIYIIACNSAIPFNPNNLAYVSAYSRAFKYGKNVIGIDASSCVCGKLYAAGDNLHLTDAGYESCALTILSILKNTRIYAGSYTYISTFSDSTNKITLQIAEVWTNGSPYLYALLQIFYGLSDLGITIDMGNSITLTKNASDKPFNVPIGGVMEGHGRIGMAGGTGNYAVPLSLTFGATDQATLRFNADAGISGTVGALVITDLSLTPPSRC